MTSPQQQKYDLLDAQAVSVSERLVCGEVPSFVQEGFFDGDFISRDRPDFVNQDGSILVEHMNVDDHDGPGRTKPFYNATKAREAEVERDLRSLLGVAIDSTVRIYVNVDTGLATDDNHRYDWYVSSFCRVVGNHARKTLAYREAFPDAKVLFLIRDESELYWERAEDSQAVACHQYWQDEIFLDAIRGSEADYVIWHRPYGFYPLGHGYPLVPRLIFMSVADLFSFTGKIYDPNRMVSASR